MVILSVWLILTVLKRLRPSELVLKRDPLPKRNPLLRRKLVPKRNPLLRSADKKLAIAE